MAEFAALHRADPVTHVLIGECPIDVREGARSIAEWADTAVVVMNIVDVDCIDPVDAAPVPGKKAISRPESAASWFSSAALVMNFTLE